MEAMIGSKFTPADVMSSNDILQLASDNAGTFRLVNMNIKRKPEQLTCKDAARALQQHFKTELDFLKFKYKNQDFSLDGNTGESLQNILKKNIEIGYQSTLGVTNKAEDIINKT